VHRPVDAPDQVYSSAKEAATWLGIGDSTFRREAKANPKLLPAASFGTAQKWFWMDLVVYAWVRRAGLANAANDDAGDEED
jgi:hypothetical protein